MTLVEETNALQTETHHNPTKAEGMTAVTCIDKPSSVSESEHNYLPKFRSSYLWRFIESGGLDKYANFAVRALANWQFDALAFTGMSGALIAPLVAMRMDKPLIMVRKRGEQSHAGSMYVEGDYNARRYIIIDDLVASGDTARRIVHEISLAMPKAQCLGLLEVNELHEELLNIYQTAQYPLYSVS